MKNLRNLLQFAPRGGSRFDRYYNRVVREGMGYPTADEARRDLRHYDQLMLTYGWPR